MRTTLTLDDDVSAALEQLRTRRALTFKGAVNEALRAGLAVLEQSGTTEVPEVRTPSLDLGDLLVPSLDDVADVLDAAEGEWRP